MRYTLLKGAGPPAGWVTPSLNFKQLLVPKKATTRQSRWQGLLDSRKAKFPPSLAHCPDTLQAWVQPDAGQMKPMRRAAEIEAEIEIEILNPPPPANGQPWRYVGQATPSPSPVKSENGRLMSGTALPSVPPMPGSTPDTPPSSGNGSPLSKTVPESVPHIRMSTGSEVPTDDEEEEEEHVLRMSIDSQAGAAFDDEDRWLEAAPEMCSGSPTQRRRGSRRSGGRATTSSAHTYRLSVGSERPPTESDEEGEKFDIEDEYTALDKHTAAKKFQLSMTPDRNEEGKEVKVMPSPEPHKLMMTPRSSQSPIMGGA